MSDHTRTPSSPDPDGSRGDRPVSHDKTKQSLSLLSLTPADLARLLTRVGGQTERVQTIQADLAADAP